MICFILSSCYANPTRSTSALGHFLPILFQARAQRAEAGITSCLQLCHKVWKCSSPGIQKHLFTSLKGWGERSAATHPPSKREHFVVPLSFPHFHINPEASLNLQPLCCFLFSAPTATGEIPVSPKPHKAASQLGYAPGPLHWDVPKRDLCKNFC